MNLDPLAAIVGPAQLLQSPEDIVRYDADGRQEGGQARAVVRPRSTAEVSALMRASASCEIPLVLQGGRTGLLGAGLANGHVVMSLERVARTPTIDVSNRTAEADAGVPLSRLNGVAGKHGLCFPIDLGADPSIGGMVATNTGGARLLRYGDVRRSLLAAEIVLADGQGTVIETGRALWKNNTGLDLKQLWVGSSGSLGVVTRATLALQPVPARRLTAMLALSDPESALDILLALENNLGSLLSAFEGMSRRALQAAFAHVPRLRPPFAGELGPYAVLIEISASRALSSELMEELLNASLEPFMQRDRPVIRDVAIDWGADLWAIRHAIPEGLRASGRVIGCDIALRRGDVMRFRMDLTDRLAKKTPKLEVHDFGHIGDGGLHFNLVWPREAGVLDAAIAELARGIVFDAVTEEYGGSFSAEHGVGPANAAYYARLIPEAERRLAGKIQRVLAPCPIGRFDFERGQTTEPARLR